MYLVLFDCDGTLVDSQHLIVEAMMRTFHRHKLSAPHRDDVLEVIGLSLPQAISRLVAPGEAVRLTDVVETYRNNFAAMRQDPHHSECLFSGALEAIDFLDEREEVLLGIATGKSRRGVDTMLAATGLNGRFNTIQTADTSPSKPDPTMVRRAIAETGVEKENTIVVGDTAYDMEMAKAAGVTGIGVAWGNHTKDALMAAGAFAVVEDFEDLVPALEEFFWTHGC